MCLYGRGVLCIRVLAQMMILFAAVNSVCDSR